MEDPIVRLERNLYGHPSAGPQGKGNSRKFFWKTDGKKFQIGNACSLTERGLFLSVYVDDIKMAGKKQNIDPMWKVPMKDFDFGRTDIIP